MAFLGAAAGTLFSTVFPSECRFCGAPLARITRIPVCNACLEDIHRFQEPVCTVCGQRLLSPDWAVGRCVECLRVEPPYERALAYGSYTGALRDLILLLKYHGVRPAAAVLGRMLAETASVLVSDCGAKRPLVIPVPLHSAKLTQRGFNQSELIARAAVKVLDKRLSVNNSALVRRRATQSQTGLSRPQRRLNMRGAFEVVRPTEVAGREILLIDDVLTTGTTASECARVLRRAGADRVFVATVARVVRVEESFVTPSEAPEDTQPAVRIARAGHA
ncbi:MAG: ComF family protein [Terriglobales bacterium]